MRAKIVCVIVVLIIATIAAGCNTAQPTVQGVIAFTCEQDGNSEICLMNHDGSGQINITNHPAEDWGPAWSSPDGQWIAFTSDRDGIQHIYLMNSDGTGVRRLTDSPYREMQPTWSPDGRRIAYYAEAEYGEIFIVEVGGNTPINLTRTPLTVESSPAWSPDGEYIAFSSMRMATDTHAPAIYLVKADGSERIQLAENGYGPRWSPDSSRIVYMCYTDSGPAICVMNVDGSAQRQLVEQAAYPQWSPDGRRIVFSSAHSDGADGIYVMLSDGTQVERLSEGQHTYPDWTSQVGALPAIVATPFHGVFVTPTPSPFPTQGAPAGPTPTLVVESAEGYAYQALILLDQGDCSGAVSDATIAIQLDAQFTVAYVVRATCEMRENQFDAAITDYSRAIQIAPDNPQLYVSRGNAYALAGQNALAVADFEQALSLGLMEPQRSQIEALVSQLGQP